MEKTILKMKYMVLFFVGFMLILAAGIVDTSDAASTVYVNTTGNDANIGTSAKPYQTIGYGITKVDDKGTVRLSTGTFNLNKGVGHSDYGITVSKNFTLQGAGSNKTIIDAKGLNRFLTINKGNVIIKDLTIKNGKALSGGSITNYNNGNLTIINCILINNIATNSGGAIYNSGNLNVTSSTLAYNTVTKGYGSAIYNYYGKAEVHFNSIFGNNGNAIYNNGGTVNAQNNWWGTNSNPGSEIENFEDINNWTPMWDATTSAVTINGDKGIKVEGANGNYPGISKTVDINFNGVAPNLQLWLYLHESDYDKFQTPVNLINIGISLQNSNDKYFQTYLIKSQLHKGLNYVVIPKNIFVSNGGMTWNDTINNIQLRVFYEPDKALNVTFLELKNNLDGVPKMVLTFDDGYTSVFTTAFPIMQEYGIKGTLYLNTALVGTPGRLTLNQLHELYDAGWTIANHAPNHEDLTTGLTTDPALNIEPIPPISVAEVKTIVKTGIDWLLANGFTRGAYHLALPWGQYNDNVLQALKELGVQTDRTVMLRMMGTPTDDLLQVTQLGPNGGDQTLPDYTTFEEAKIFIDNTIQSKATTFVMLHKILDNPVSSTEWATADFTNWIAYLAQTGIDTKTADTWYNEIIGVTYSKVNYNPWIVVEQKISKTMIPITGTSNVTADFTHNSNGEDISAQGHIPDGTTVKFISDSLGTVNPVNAITINGKATTTFKAGLNPGVSEIKSTIEETTSSSTLNIYYTVLPVITSTYPVNNAVNIAKNVVVKINFSKIIELVNNSGIVFKTSNGTLIPYTLSITGSTLNITPKSPLASSTQYTIIVNTDCVTDLAGAGLVEPYTTKFTTIIPPVVTSSDPVNYALNVAINKVIKITFNKAIKLRNNPWIELKTSSGTQKAFTSSITGNVLSLTPKTPLSFGTKYTVIIHSNAVTDLNGIGLESAYTTKFSTPAATPPVVIRRSPVNNQVNIPLNKVITFTFNEAIKFGSNPWIELKTSSGTSKTFKATISGNTLSIKPNTLLARGTTYTAIIHSKAVTDIYGSGLATSNTIRFSTIS